MDIVKLFALLFSVEAQTHIYHLQTKSFAQHSALNEFYKGIPELRDELIEKYQGKYGVVKGYANITFNRFADYGSINEPIVYLELCVKQVEDFRPTLTDGYLQQILDNIIELFYETLYKLKNLS